MAIAEDTDWLRRQLNEPDFAAAYGQTWVAVHDRHVVRSDPENASLTAWLEENDPERLCVLAFVETRVML